MSKILVAEDDAHVIRLLSIWLTRNGYEVIEATDGEQAREHLAAGGITCLMTDINMPKMDGLELVRWLRDEAGQDIPVIMLSARCDQEKIDVSLKGYGVVFHPKPFSPSRLISELKQLVSAAPVNVT